MYLPENIRYMRKYLDMSQEDLAQKLGYKSYTTIQKWESGVSEPPLKKLKEMADLFGLDMDDLTSIKLQSSKEFFRPFIGRYLEEYPDSFEDVSKVISVPVVRRVAAGVPIDSIEEVIGHEGIMGDMAQSGIYFGLKIQGDSMAPGIADGDTVICRQQPDAEDGQIVVALVNGNDGVCKRLKKYEDGTIALISDNAAYPPMYFNNSEIDNIPVHIMGIVKELRRKF